MFKTVFSKTGRLLLSLLAVLLMPGVPSWGAGQTDIVSIDMENVPLEKVLQEIETQTKYVFLNRDVDVKQTVSISVSARPVKEVLAVLFEGKNISYAVEAGHIIISSKDSVYDSRGGYRITIISYPGQ